MRMRNYIGGGAVILGLMLAALLYGRSTVEAQQGRWDRSAYEALDFSERTVFPGNEFTFCRVRYTSEIGYENRFGADRWSIDYPESDRHFSWRLSELTTLDVAKDRHGQYKHAVVQLTDEALYNYPFLYLIEPGYLVFSEEEVERLRDYLLRGGFLMVDDFWGQREWINWETQIGRVFDPETYPIVDLELEHPIFHMVFDLDEKPQVPTPWDWQRGIQSEAGEVSYRGIYDPAGRLMMVICHNTDLGDGWEREGEALGYFEEVSAKKAYPMGINIVVYAMTH